MCSTLRSVLTVRQAKTRRGRAAFAKITTGVLLELGLHHPLAAAIGRRGQSEWALALELLAQVPARALLLADRLHGCAAFVAVAQAACEKVGSHFLIRARSNLRVQVLRRLKDGSRLVRVPVRAKGEHHVVSSWLELREIRVRVQRPGHRAQELRLWTSLLDPKRAPAQELSELYARLHHADRSVEIAVDAEAALGRNRQEPQPYFITFSIISLSA